mgnify:FL=1
MSDLFDVRLSVCTSCLRPVVYNGSILSAHNNKPYVCTCSKIKEQAKATQKQKLDLDKNCGVIISSTGLPCLRSLTCKSHSLTSKRKVLGRSRPFDELLKEKNAAMAKKNAPVQENASLRENKLAEVIAMIGNHNRFLYEQPHFPASYKQFSRRMKYHLGGIFNERF